MLNTKFCAKCGHRGHYLEFQQVGHTEKVFLCSSCLEDFGQIIDTSLEVFLEPAEEVEQTKANPSWPYDPCPVCFGTGYVEGTMYKTNGTKEMEICRTCSGTGYTYWE